MKLRIAVLLLLLFLGAGSSASQPKPVITLERTACFGWCPVYAIKIFRNGEVHYEGREFVAFVGRDVARISPEEVDSLVRRFLEIDYFNLKNSYRTKTNPDGSVTMITDLPTTYTSLLLEGRYKRVENYAFAPEALGELELEIDRVAGTHRWLHASDDLKDWQMVAHDIYTRSKPGMTPLMRAAGAGDPKALQREYDSGADPNARDSTGWTALMLAASQCRLEAVRQLLKWNASADFADANGDTALIAAAAAFCSSEEMRVAQVEILRLLVRRGCNPNVQNQMGETALMWVVRYGNLNALRELLKAGASATIKDNKGRTALQRARAALKEFDDHFWTPELRQVVAVLEGQTPKR